MAATETSKMLDSVLTTFVLRITEHPFRRDEYST